MKFSLRFRESVVARAWDGRIVIALIGDDPWNVVVADGWPREVHALRSKLEHALKQTDEAPEA